MRVPQSLAASEDDPSSPVTCQHRRSAVNRLKCRSFNVNRLPSRTKWKTGKLCQPQSFESRQLSALRRVNSRPVAEEQLFCGQGEFDRQNLPVNELNLQSIQEVDLTATIPSGRCCGSWKTGLSQKLKFRWRGLFAVAYVASKKYATA